MFSVQAPTVRGEIKKARASNYNWLRSICEFIDNAIDALLKDTTRDILRCLIKFNVDSNNDLISIHISDNYEKGISDGNVWTWTYERKRSEHDSGEYGTGFKSGSVNISSYLRLITRSGDKYIKVDADWNDMMEENTWTPDYKDVDENYYKSSSSPLCFTYYN